MYSKLSDVAENVALFKILSNMMIQKNDLDKAIYYLNKSINLAIELKRNRGLINSYLSIGTLYITQNRLQKACTAWQKAINFSENNKLSSFPKIVSAIKRDLPTIESYIKTHCSN